MSPAGARRRCPCWRAWWKAGSQHVPVRAAPLRAARGPARGCSRAPPRSRAHTPSRPVPSPPPPGAAPRAGPGTRRGAREVDGARPAQPRGGESAPARAAVTCASAAGRSGSREGGEVHSGISGALRSDTLTSRGRGRAAGGGCALKGGGARPESLRNGGGTARSGRRCAAAYTARAGLRAGAANVPREAGVHLGLR